MNKSIIFPSQTKSLVRVESVRYFKSTGKEEKDTRLYITSLDANAPLIRVCP